MLVINPQMPFHQLKLSNISCRHKQVTQGQSTHAQRKQERYECQKQPNCDYSFSQRLNSLGLEINIKPNGRDQKRQCE